MIQLSKEQARRALIHYHNLDGNQNLYGLQGVRTIMDKIGSIQYDPLQVIGRNADLVLQARVNHYNPNYLSNLLYEERRLVDGFDKEMCIYNAKDFGKFQRIREATAEACKRTLGFRNQMEALDLLDEVYDFVKKHGSTGTKDISIGEVREGTWGHRKLSSAALDYLYNQGKLCVAMKKGTQKYFDLTERLLSENDRYLEEVSQENFLDWYVNRRIASIGLLWDKKGGAWQGHYLYNNELRREALQRLVSKQTIHEYEVQGIKATFYGNSEFQKSLEEIQIQQYDASFVRFLAPLDNLLWDRKLLQELFDFSYSWEVYTPVLKRQYGYYVLPVLYKDKLVARFEAEPLTTAKCFKMKQWWWENDVMITQELLFALEQEMERFALAFETKSHPDNFNKFIVS